ncbi:hypothetical protein BJV78DRAFT_1356411 [Lactifluus subvellereus]|nr:hypothetical protein BJV78DRAFT_1356411 [Lactifluus subvellereus]
MCPESHTIPYQDVPCLGRADPGNLPCPTIIFGSQRDSIFERKTEGLLGHCTVLQVSVTKDDEVRPSHSGPADPAVGTLHRVAALLQHGSLPDSSYSELRLTSSAG